MIKLSLLFIMTFALTYCTTHLMGTLGVIENKGASLEALLVALYLPPTLHTSRYLSL